MDGIEQTVVQGAEQQARAQELSVEKQDAPPLEAPDIPGYLLERPLGRGSFGEVWEATQSGSGQKVAVKVFTHPGGLDWRYLQHEVHRLRSVAEHPNVVTLHDADFNYEPPYFCMGLYKQSLSGWRKENPEVRLSQIAEWFRDMARALQYTHDKGLLHCDLKPANVLLDEEGRVKVADFGQAVDKRLPTSAMGSLGYMAPEQATLDNPSPDVRWDVYGLGATVYYLLTGRAPRLSEQSRETMGSITDPTERLERYREIIGRAELEPIESFLPQIDSDLNHLVRACLELDPSRRPESMGEVLEDLDRRLDGRPLLCRKPWPTSYRVGRFVRRHAWPVLLVLVILGSLGALMGNTYENARVQRKALARQEFEKGWALSQEGELTEAALWWLRALERDPDNQPARAALESLAPPLERTLVHGDQPINAVFFDPSGEWLVSASSGFVHLWKDGRKAHSIALNEVEEPDNYYLPIPKAALTPDGRRLVTPVGVYPLGEGELKPLFTLDGQVHVTPTGILRTGPENAEVIDPDSGARRPVDLGSTQVAQVAFSADGQKMAVISKAGQVHLEREGRLGPPLSDGQVAGGIGCFAFSPDGKMLVTGSDDRMARLWSTQDGSVIHRLDHGWWVVGARFSDDGKELITASYHGNIHLWDVERGSPIVRSPMAHSWIAYGTTARGERMASFSIDGKARVWDQATGTPVTPWLRHGSPVKAVAFRPDGEQLVSAGQDGRLQVWKVDSGRAQTGRLIDSRDHELNTVALDPRGELLATGWHVFPSGGGVQLWTLKGERQGPELDHGGAVREVTFSPDGERLATACDDGKVRVFDRRGTLLETQQHGGPVRTVAFSKDGASLLSGGYDGSARIWGREPRTFQLPPGRRPQPRVEDVKWSPDESKIATGDDQGRAIIWDRNTGEQQQTFQYDSALRRVVWGPRGRHLLVGTRDGTAALVDLTSGKAKKFHHSLMVTNGDFDPSGSRVVTASLDGSVSLWEVAGGQPLPSPEGHRGPVLVARFSADGELLLTVSKDGTAQLWESHTGQPLGLPIRHLRLAYDGFFSADGRSVVTVAHDGVTQLTPVPLTSGKPAPVPHELEKALGFELHEQEGRCSLRRLTSSETP